MREVERAREVNEREERQRGKEEEEEERDVQRKRGVERKRGGVIGRERFTPRQSQKVTGGRSKRPQLNHVRLLAHLSTVRREQKNKTKQKLFNKPTQQI